MRKRFFSQKNLKFISDFFSTEDERLSQFATIFFFQVILEKVVPRIKNVLDGVKDSAPVTV